MDQNAGPVLELSPTESFALLETHVLGRVVTWIGDVVDIFPVNYVVDTGGVVIRTAEGTKLAEMLIGGELLFEADQYGDAEAWSVVIRGTARLLETEAEIAAAEALPLKPMVPTIKRNFVRITPLSVTGRRFIRGEEPRRDGPQDY